MSVARAELVGKQVQHRLPEPELATEAGADVKGRGRAEAEDLVRGAEREAAWKRLAVEAPEYVKYLEKTDREIPVIRLRRQ